MTRVERRIGRQSARDESGGQEQAIYKNFYDELSLSVMLELLSLWSLGVAYSLVARHRWISEEAL